MCFIHDIPGRLRVKLESLKNKPERLKEVQTLLMADGVHRVKISPLTGSIVVEYNPDILTSSHLLDILRADGHPIDMEHPVDQSFFENHEKIVLKVSKAAVSWLAGQVLEANGLSLIAALI